jgi:hypothetical protein
LPRPYNSHRLMNHREGAAASPYNTMNEATDPLRTWIKSVDGSNPKHAVEQAAGSPLLAAAAHRGR